MQGVLNISLATTLFVLALSTSEGMSTRNPYPVYIICICTRMDQGGFDDSSFRGRGFKLLPSFSIHLGGFGTCHSRMLWWYICMHDSYNTSTELLSVPSPHCVNFRGMASMASLPSSRKQKKKKQWEMPLHFSVPPHLQNASAYMDRKRFTNTGQEVRLFLSR